MSLYSAQLTPPSRGTFQAAVTGAVEAVLAGVAAFGVRRNERGTDILAIVLRLDLPDGSEHVVLLSNAVSEVPRPGRFGFGDMGPDTFVGIFSHTTSVNKTGSFPADRGTLEIIDSGPVHLHGTFEFDGSGAHNYEFWAEEGEVHIFGVFNAARIADPFAMAFPRSERE